MVMVSVHKNNPAAKSRRCRQAQFLSMWDYL